MQRYRMNQSKLMLVARQVTIAGTTNARKATSLLLASLIVVHRGMSSEVGLMTWVGSRRTIVRLTVGVLMAMGRNLVTRGA